MMMGFCAAGIYPLKRDQVLNRVSKENWHLYAQVVAVYSLSLQNSCLGTSFWILPHGLVVRENKEFAMSIKNIGMISRQQVRKKLLVNKGKLKLILIVTECIPL